MLCRPRLRRESYKLVQMIDWVSLADPDVRMGSMVL